MTPSSISGEDKKKFFTDRLLFDATYDELFCEVKLSKISLPGCAILLMPSKFKGLTLGEK